MKRIRCTNISLGLFLYAILMLDGAGIMMMVAVVEAFQSSSLPSVPSSSFSHPIRKIVPVMRRHKYDEIYKNCRSTYHHLIPHLHNGRLCPLELDLDLNAFPHPVLHSSSSSLSLFMVPNENENEKAVENDKEKRRMKLYQMPISKLLSILERSNITIPPTASRQELVDLIMEEDHDERVDTNVNVNVDRRTRSSRRRRQQRQARNNGEREYKRISNDGDGGTSTSSRRTRTRTPRNSANSEDDNDEDVVDDGDDPMRQRRERQRRRKIRQQRNNSLPPSNNQWDEIVSNEFITPTAKATASFAKKVGRQAVDGVTNVADNLSKEDLKRMGRKAVDGVTSGVTNVADNLSKTDFTDWMSISRYRRELFNQNGGGDDADENGVKEADWYYNNRSDDDKVKNRWGGDAGGGDMDGARGRSRQRRRAEKTVVEGESGSGETTIGTSSDVPLNRKRRVRPKGRPWPGSTRSTSAPSPARQRKPRSATTSRDEEVLDEVSERMRSETGDEKKRKRKPVMALLPPSSQDAIYIPDMDKNGNHNDKDKTEDDSTSTTNEEGVKDSFKSKTSSSRVPEDRGKKSRPRPRHRRGDSTRDGRSSKKVYSAYPPADDCGEDDSLADLELLYGKTAADAIDSVGEFVADVVEGKYFNGTRTQASTDKTPTAQRGSKRQKRKRRYWRDKLAERVDYALGVHEDGKYYRSWEEQLKRDREREVEGNDPVSIFYGRQKKKRRRGDEQSPRRRRESRKIGPFWEEDGSLMSLLFGRNVRGNDLAFNKMLERQNFSSVNTCTLLFKSLFQSSIAVLSYLCRWASCRGALPQPIIVFVLAASALSAPRRKRLITVGFTLIALRTLAEAAHGYMYGNDDWEDDDKYEEEDYQRGHPRSGRSVGEAKAAKDADDH